MRPTSVALLLVAACAAPVAAPVAPPIPAGEDPLRWRADIETFASQPTAAEAPVVFVGSSSIRRWSTLARDMAPLPVLNRGFGGSRIFDSVYWLDRLVTCHHPAVVVVFAGTNDIQGDAPRSAAWVAARFEELVSRLRALGCDAPLVYLAISPSPSRERHLPIVLDANARIAALCARDPSLHFVDTASALLDERGCPDPRWFVADRLHLNPAGYAHWTKTLRPVVTDLYAKRNGGRAAGT
ncbi:MAG: GDSL-type esterase/lipase family protein [Planctomycetota bacterium]